MTFVKCVANDWTSKVPFSERYLLDPGKQMAQEVRLPAAAELPANCLSI